MELAMRHCLSLIHRDGVTGLKGQLLEHEVFHQVAMNPFHWTDWEEAALASWILTGYRGDRPGADNPKNKNKRQKMIPRISMIHHHTQKVHLPKHLPCASDLASALMDPAESG